ncbi:MAG: recombinase family protein [Oscillospiraceae bacterium]|jgi:DNA invertase Pin-like site-specific DNA recombinase|nr:recombinase family protein [Oscillospiraceae bacterium]
MNKQPEQTKYTALYERLSREDALTGESLSIQNQKQILEEYAAKNGFANVRHFFDDGTTGIHFDRDGWQQLMAEVEAGNVAACIITDMTRFGRDHVEVGRYMEIFRKNNVRFIAFGHNIDSQYPETLEIAPFINIMSEWYSRDNSRKLKTVFRAKGKSGKRTTNKCIYGYVKDPQDKSKWLVDTEAAPIIRRIFQMTVEGMGPFQIARALEAEQIETPGYHMAQIGVGDHQWNDEKRRFEWNPSTVAKIIAKPEYAGHTVNLRTEKAHFKDRNVTWKPKEDWLIFENTHEAVVAQDVWDTAQKCRTIKRRTDTLGEANPLTGFLYCSDCGRRLYNHRAKAHRTTDGRTGRVVEKKEKNIYTCPTYYIHHNDCSMHYISAKSVGAVILETIQRATVYARENEAAFVEIIREASAVRHGETVKAHRRQISKNEKRIAELDTLFRKTYEDFAAGLLSEKRFGQLSGGYESEQETLERQTAEMKNELERFAGDGIRADKFLELARRHTDFSELTAPLIAEFIDRVIVHEADRSSGKREQKVDIYLNFIGQFAPPDEAEPEDAEAEEKRAVWREYKRKERAEKNRAGQGKTA